MRLFKPSGLLRAVLALVLVWLLGFLWFALLLPRPAGPDHTDGVIVLTGGPGRIARGLEVLRAGQAQRLLVSGVDPQVTRDRFANEYAVPPAQFACCVTLGYRAYDTRSNAREAADWIVRHRMHSVRLVTTDWHMRRAAFDLTVAGPRGLTIIEDAVPSQPAMKMLFVEYNKLLARMAAWLVGWPPVPSDPAAGHDHA